MTIFEYSFATVFALLIISCHDGGDPASGGGDSLTVPPTTHPNGNMPLSTVTPTVKAPLGRPVFVERARLEEPNKTIVLTSWFLVPDTAVSDRDSDRLPSATYLIASYPKEKKADTARLELKDGNLAECYQCAFIIRDVTDSLDFKTLTVQVVIPHDEPSDLYYENIFFGYKDGGLTTLFSVDDYAKDGMRFHRADATNLDALTYGQDDLIGSYEPDYIFHVNTVNFQTWRTDPNRQYIGGETTVAEAFKAHRMVNGVVDSSLVSVKVGMKVRIDTLYRDLGKVRLWVEDSTAEVEIKVETARKKLVKPPAAG
jgi:hypothetical protein